MRQGCHFLAFLLRSQPNALLFLAWRQNTFLQFHVYVKLITVLCAMPFLSEVHVYIQGGSKQKRGVGKWKKHSQGHHWLNVFFCVLALFSWSYLRIWKDLFKRLHEKQGQNHVFALFLSMGPAYYPSCPPSYYHPKLCVCILLAAWKCQPDQVRKFRRTSSSSFISIGSRYIQWFIVSSVHFLECKFHFPFFELRNAPRNARLT